MNPKPQTQNPQRQTVNVGLVQMRMSESPDANLERALAMTREAAEGGADGVGLPELFPLPVLLPDRGLRPVRARRAGAGADDRGV